jgi:nucleoside-diphosphate kinase
MTLRTDTSFGMVKPDMVHDWDVILNLITLQGFKIVFHKRCRLTREDIEFLYTNQKDKPFFEEMVKFLTENDVVLFLVQKICETGAVKDLKEFCGDTDPSIAKQKTLRKLFGKSKTRNAVHASDSEQNAKRESIYFFKKEAENIWATAA